MAAPEAAGAAVAPAGPRGPAFARALGGASNLVTVDACTTRLRLAVRDQGLVDEAALRALGARGFVRPSDTALQVVLGPHADQVAGEIRAALKQGGEGLAAALRRFQPQSVRHRQGRVMLSIPEATVVDEAALKRHGVLAVWRRGAHLHLLFGPGGAALAEAVVADLAA